MSRFFFHSNNCAERSVQDDEGFEFASLHDAKCQAVAFAGRALADTGQKFWDDKDFELTVTDDRGYILFNIRVTGTEAPAARQASRQR